MENSVRDFGLWLRRILEERELTGADLARRMEVRDSTVSRILGGKAKPSPLTLDAMSKALNIPFDELMGRAGYPSNPSLKILPGVTQEQMALISDTELMGLARKLKNLPPTKRGLFETLMTEFCSEEANDKTKQRS